MVSQECSSVELVITRLPQTLLITRHWIEIMNLSRNLDETIHWHHFHQLFLLDADGAQPWRAASSELITHSNLSVISGFWNSLAKVLIGICAHLPASLRGSKVPEKVVTCKKHRLETSKVQIMPSKNLSLLLSDSGTSLAQFLGCQFVTQYFLFIYTVFTPDTAINNYDDKVLRYSTNNEKDFTISLSMKAFEATAMSWAIG